MKDATEALLESLSLSLSLSLIHTHTHTHRLYPEEKAAMKDAAEALLEPGEWKKSDMFFEYRVKEGEEVCRKMPIHCNILQRTATHRNALQHIPMCFLSIE